MNEITYTPPAARSQGADLTAAEARSIAAQFWAIEWESDTHGFMPCPGAHLHSTRNGKRDCKIHVCNDGKPPTIHCLHSSCSAVIEAANKTLRSALGRAGASGGITPADSPQPQNPTTKKAPVLDSSPIPLPSPIAGGFLRMMELCFLPEEFVSIAQTDVETEKPSSGMTRTREKWEQAYREKSGIEWEVLSCDYNKLGLYIRVNPMKKGGATNDDVTAFRHVLVEFDRDKSGSAIPKAVQFGILTRSGLPITTITDSGNKSLHAWVRVDAKDATEYRDRAEQIYALFEQYGVDKANRNPSRLSRCPEGLREIAEGDIRTQHLLATSIGPRTWAEYQAAQNVAMVGDSISVTELLDYDTKNDPNSVIGSRWLCKGSTALIVAQSGIGKSSLAMQWAIGWGVGDPIATFGMKPIRPLKSLFIQAENDRGDMAEQLQGVVNAMSLTPEQIRDLNEKIVIYRDATHSGHEFLAIVESLVRIHKPDLVWIDPLLNYIGDEISDQSVCSAFTQRVSGIAIETGCIFLIMHHTGKPKTDGSKTASDLAYAGLGSSVLTAWAREVIVLERAADSIDGSPCFKLTMTKRRRRAGLYSLEEGWGAPSCYIQHHSGEGILWLLAQKPAEPQDKQKRQSKQGGWRRQNGKWTKNDE
ncbi:MAG: hypothetical protein RLZZ142_648 [Verrucomicrobiota bacterium]